MRHAGTAIFLIILLSLAGLGVYYYDAYHKLSFELVDLSLKSLGPTSAVANCTMRISNPGLLPIYISSGDASVHVNNVYLGKGHFGSTTISGGVSGNLVVPIGFNFTDIIGGIGSIITTGGKATIALNGSAHLILLDVPFSTILYNATLG
jgi:LEA14-like dessication related protein